jgi:hypothetical protein
MCDYVHGIFKIDISNYATFSIAHIFSSYIQILWHTLTGQTICEYIDEIVILKLFMEITYEYKMRLNVKIGYDHACDNEKW